MSRVPTARVGILQECRRMDQTSHQLPGLRHQKVLRIGADGSVEQDDVLVVEEPLEIRLTFGAEQARREIPLSITMRTPGDDIDLVCGFLLTEGIAHVFSDILDIQQVSDNVVRAALIPEANFVPENIQRHFYTTSSCGVCGKASIDMVRQVSAFRLNRAIPEVNADILMRIAGEMRGSQPMFAATGGIHATALYDRDGTLHCVKEDIGRHNAMDKMIGWSAVHQHLPLSQHIVVVSGRGGFELVQKAASAGVPVFAAVGAPSSLAVELAEESDMTLVGFLREDKMNVYTHPGRLKAWLPANRII